LYREYVFIMSGCGVSEVVEQVDEVVE
jgi:hypothetical protein